MIQKRKAIDKDVRKTKKHPKHRRSFTWVKDKEGNTFLCPKQELVDPTGMNETELKKYCIDESTTPPWND
jgi:hypothetical protein